MRDKLHNAKNYVAEHKAGFLIGGVVIFVYAATLATAVYNYKNMGIQYEIAKLQK